MYKISNPFRINVIVLILQTERKECLILRQKKYKDKLKASRETCWCVRCAGWRCCPEGARSRKVTHGTCESCMIKLGGGMGSGMRQSWGRVRRRDRAGHSTSHPNPTIPGWGKDVFQTHSPTFPSALTLQSSLAGSLSIMMSSSYHDLLVPFPLLWRVNKLLPLITTWLFSPHRVFIFLL